VTSRGVALGWMVVALGIVVVLGYELAQWRALAAESTGAAAERRRLADDVQLRSTQLAAEMRLHAARLRDLQWSAVGADPSAFLGRLAELARQQRTRITTVGPLERRSTPQFTKSWHVVQVIGPYREIRELIARVERDRGVLEDVRIEPAPGRPDGPGAPDEVQARFRLTALELSPQARSVVDRVVAAASPAAPGLPPLPPADLAETGPARDPFVFAAGRPGPAPSGSPPPPPPPPPPAASPPRPARPPAPMELSAIVGFPGGYAAIINNQIVKVGDMVNGATIERITATSVSVREPDAPPRTVELPELGAPPPAAPRR
jgi:hypothetical protein